MRKNSAEIKPYFSPWIVFVGIIILISGFFKEIYVTFAGFKSIIILSDDSGSFDYEFHYVDRRVWSVYLIASVTVWYSAHRNEKRSIWDRSNKSAAELFSGSKAVLVAFGRLYGSIRRIGAALLQAYFQPQLHRKLHLYGACGQ